jgi:hypothetical protein
MADFTPSPNESITALADFNLATIRSSVTTISWSCDHLLVINFARLLCGRISRGDHLPDQITCRSTCLARNRIQMPEFSKQHLEILRARGENTKPDIVEEVNGNVPVTESTTSKPTIVAPGAAADFVPPRILAAIGVARSAFPFFLGGQANRFAQLLGQPIISGWLNSKSKKEALR